MRQEIVNAVIDRLRSLGIFKQVADTWISIEEFKPFHTPSAFVLLGRENREYSGSRVICYFDVIIRLLIYDKEHLTTKLNDTIQQVLSIFEEDPYLGGKSDFPVQVVDIEPTEGFFAPFEVADITVRTVYTIVSNA